MWWVATPNEYWPEDEESFKQIKSRWEEPYGDRQQELVIIGIKMDQSYLTEKFDSCLMTDDEIALGMEAWKTLNDPFPKWQKHEEQIEVI
jgi:hypothetical protein